METIKLGSKGESVKLLQRHLNVTADGDFGPKTEAAVKEFQKKKGLEADGIVGEKTWKALGVANNSSFITKSPLSVHISKSSNKQNKYIVLHYTAGGSSKPGSAMSVKHVFESRQASSDFVVDDSTILQLNPDLDKYYTWHCGDKNYGNKGGSLYGKCKIVIVLESRFVLI